jgi:PEP-CTERM motif
MMTLDKLLSTALLVSVAGGLGVTEARADVNVFVGYADSLRPSGFFPTPWLGASGVVSESSSAQLFDAGAVRIDNTGASAVTISGMTVQMNGGSGPTYAIWSPLVVGAGDVGIFTQTAQYNFDSSDNSFATPPGNIGATDPGGNGIGGCSGSAGAQGAAGITGLCDSRQPIVSFLINGTAATPLNDTGHILDTGNYDFINGSPDGNESINWNKIGSEASRGGTVPEPSTWAMMLIGFGGLCFAGYRTKKSIRTAVAA